MSTVDLADLLQAYESLPRTLHLPRLERVRLRVEPRPSVPENRANELLDLIDEYRSGWIAFRSGVDWFAPERPLVRDRTSLGPMLAAEFATDGDSLHLQFDGAADAGWLLVDYHEGGGDHYLVEDVTLLSETWSEARLNLRYRRYWGLAEDGTMRPIFARFAGFTKDGG